MAQKDMIRRTEIIFLFVLAAFIVLFRAQAAHMPLDVNEGSHAYGAAQIMNKAVPYKSFFEHRPPFMLYVYKTAFTFFGQTVEAIRTFTTLYVIAVMLAVFMLARVIWRGAFISMLAVFFYVIYQHTLIFQGLSANAAVYAQLPIVLSILFILDREKAYESVNFCLSGFFAAAALLTDVMSVLYLAAALLYMIFYCRRNVLKSLLWFFIGYLAVLAAAAGWALYNHIIYDIYTSVIVYNLKALKTAVKGMSPGSFIWANIFPFIALLFAVWKVIRENNNGRIFILSVCVIMLYIPVYLIKGSQPHYYLSLIPGLALLCAFMVSEMYALLNEEKEVKPYAWMILAMFMVLNAAVVSNANKTGFFLKSGFYTDEVNYEARAMAHTIILSSENMEAKENFIFAWPDMPAVYFTAGVKASSRYSYSYPIAVFEQDRQTLTDGLVYGRPVWVIMQRGKYQQFQAFLDNFYAKTAETKNLVLYKNILF